MLYGETDRLPLFAQIQLRTLLYWGKIISGKCNPMLTSLYHISLSNYLKHDQHYKWLKFVKTTLDNLGFSNIWQNQNIPSFNWFKCAVKLRISDQSLQLINNSVFSSTKGTTYHCMKSDCNITHLQTKLGTMHFNTLLKFKTSNHKLPVETGRWENIPRNERFCPFCPGQTGDEFHYIFECKNYNAERNLYINKYFTIRPNFYKMSILFKSTNISVLRNLCKFISIIMSNISSS